MRHKVIGLIVWLGIAAIVIPFFIDGDGLKHMEEQAPEVGKAKELDKTSIIIEKVSSADFQQATTVTPLEKVITPSATASKDTASTTPHIKQSIQPKTSNIDVQDEARANPTKTASTKQESTKTANQEQDTTVKASSSEAMKSGWSVQLASFRNKANATTLRNKLLKAKYQAYTRINGEYMQVLVGPYSDRKQSEKAMVKLKKDFKLSGIVVVFKS